MHVETFSVLCFSCRQVIWGMSHLDCTLWPFGGLIQFRWPSLAMSCWAGWIVEACHVWWDSAEQRWRGRFLCRQFMEEALTFPEKPLGGWKKQGEAKSRLWLQWSYDFALWKPRSRWGTIHSARNWAFTSPSISWRVSLGLVDAQIKGDTEPLAKRRQTVALCNLLWWTLSQTMFKSSTSILKRLCPDRLSLCICKMRGSKNASFGKAVRMEGRSTVQGFRAASGTWWRLWERPKWLTHLMR